MTDHCWIHPAAFEEATKDKTLEEIGAEFLAAMQAADDGRYEDLPDYVAMEVDSAS